MKIFTWIKRLFLTLSFLALIATNVLTLTSTAFNAALSSMMSTAFGVQTVYTKHKAATKRFGKRLIRRTKRIATASVVSIPGEAIPVIGATLLIAGTSYELYAACESMKDLDELYSDTSTRKYSVFIAGFLLFIYPYPSLGVLALAGIVYYFYHKHQRRHYVLPRSDS
jgi:hypothetical protein